MSREFNFALNTRDHKVVVTHNPVEPSVSDDLFRIQKAREAPQARRKIKRDSERKRRVNSSTVRGHQRFVFPKVSDFTADLSGLDDFLDGLLPPLTLGLLTAFLLDFMLTLRHGKHIT